MTACTQPGCGGSVVDGYCDVCGSPGQAGVSTGVPTALASTPASAPAAPGGPGTGAGTGTPRRAVPSQSGTGCVQPGCGGQVVDGYCDVCGSPGPAGAPSPGAPAPQPAGTGAAGTGLQANGAQANGAQATGPQATGQGRPGARPGGGEAADAPIPAASPLSEAAGVGSSITRSSSRLGSTALGSKRAAGSGSVQTRRISSGSQRLRSARLGAGLTRVPPAPSVEPLKAVLVNPQVPENKRTCPSCGAPVGRSRDGLPGRTEGFCPKCRNPFSFTPKLVPGELVAGQYEVAGCLAHGGLGWIYLARDKNVSDRWVVLKGLLNTGDADALAVAIVERQFLAQVEHPLIVEIYNFVTHDSGDGEPAGYIVMEYVGGLSLKQILKRRMEAAGGAYDPLPVDQALAYVLEVLPAFTYLHDLGLVYCDFKPDNLIQIGDDVKLIDLGGVRRIDDDDSAIYGTVGYQAPEVARQGTSVASDIYTIGRTLAVLVFEFRGYQSRYVDSLPPPHEVPVLEQQDSLHRLLLKACAPDPADRFSSVDEMRVQVLGVLREVVAEKTVGTSLTSAASVLFEAPAVTGDVLDWRALPALRPDTTDAQFAWLSNVSVDDPAERFAALESAPERTAEIQLARAAAALSLGRWELVEAVVTEMLSADPWEWRAVWVSGLAHLGRGDFAGAQAAFNAVYGQVPGELAAKLALALACERGDEGELAERLYLTCVRTDANYVGPAAFGLARLRRARGDVSGAVEALDLVPTTSRGFTEARRLRAATLLESADAAPAGARLGVLAESMRSLDGVRLDPVEQAGLQLQILQQALAEVDRTAGTVVSHDQAMADRAVRIGNVVAEPGALRDAVEATFRTLAQNEPDATLRHRLVDEANRVRKWTLL